jgi:orotate phosphoribosyltransferase
MLTTFQSLFLEQVKGVGADFSETFYSEEISQRLNALEVDASLWLEYEKIFQLNQAHEAYKDDSSENSWINSNIKFLRHSSIAGHEVYALYDYFPKRYSNAPEEVKEIRSLVYNFKNGLNSTTIAYLVASAIYNQFFCNGNTLLKANAVLAVIPASSAAKTLSRFKGFCELVSNYLGIANGYTAITIENDREVLKGTTGTNKTNNLLYYPHIFKGKTVFLFDDVKTTGQSFKQNAYYLNHFGASKVIGIFLAETYDSHRHGEPAWNLNKTTSGITYAKDRNGFPILGKSELNTNIPTYEEEPEDLPF